MDGAVEKRSLGRPRSEVCRRAILEAAYELLSEGGLASFTVDGVATRSGVARTTIYRWWPSRGALAIEAFLTATASQVRFRRTASAATDIKKQLRLVGQMMRGRAGRIIRGIVAEAQSDPDTAQAFVEGYIEIRRREARAILLSGIDSGEFRANLDVDAVMDALYGALYHRLLLFVRPLEDAWIDSVADIVLNGCRPPSHPPGHI